MHFSENWKHNSHCFECMGKIREFVDRNNWQEFENEEGGLFFVRCPLDHQDLTFLDEKIMQRTGKVQYKFSIKLQKHKALQVLSVLR